MDRTWNAPRTVRTAITAAVFMSMLLGCAMAGQTVEVGKLGHATHILVYEGGKPVSERAIAAGSREDRIIEAWLGSHADGWRTDRKSYAPHRYMKGPQFTLNFQSDRCILNYQLRDGGRWKQVSRPIRRDEMLPTIFGRSQ